MASKTGNLSTGIGVIHISLSKFLEYIILAIAIIMVVALPLSSRSAQPDSPDISYREYQCDVRFALNTKIVVTKEEELVGEISGNIFKFITDPLQMTKDGKVISYADDSYNLINQDDHAIFVNNEYQFTMHGGWALTGEVYDIRDADNNIVGFVEFDAWDVSGSLTLPSGATIATYSSSLLSNDYTIKIYNDSLNDNAILLLFAFYYSDHTADSGYHHHSINH